jgi:hypothetical protein
MIGAGGVRLALPPGPLPLMFHNYLDLEHQDRHDLPRKPSMNAHA